MGDIVKKIFIINARTNALFVHTSPFECAVYLLGKDIREQIVVIRKGEHNIIYPLCLSGGDVGSVEKQINRLLDQWE